jgi:hypothetical protein
MGKFNPFQSMTKEEQEAKEKSVLETAKKIQEVRIAAQACLKLPEFLVYVDRYKKAEAVLVKTLIGLEEADPMKKVLLVTELQAKLKILGSLMADVTKDAK